MLASRAGWCSGNIVTVSVVSGLELRKLGSHNRRIYNIHSCENYIGGVWSKLCT